MFCPACGKKNAIGQKYCAGCGINLEAVSQALTRREDDFFTKMDVGIDQFLSRYSERVFKNPQPDPLDRRVGKSWKILGKGVVTSFVDLLLFLLMWNLIPLRFLLLLLSTPIRLVSERGKSKQGTLPQTDEPIPALEDRPAQRWLEEPGASVTEHTTLDLTHSSKQNVK